MIQIDKGEKPEWLKNNAAAKTVEYKAAPKKKKGSPWRADEIVEALKNECSSKCMYCEGMIDDVSYSAVEHIKPKSKFEDLVLEWQNLGLVCPRCNTNKNDYWTDNPDLKLLNPYEDALNDHIYFAGPITAARLESSRADNTIRQLKLHSREDLFLSRSRRIQELYSSLRLWRNESDMEKKAVYAEDVIEAISRNREFSGVLRAYAINSGFPVE